MVCKPFIMVCKPFINKNINVNGLQMVYKWNVNKLNGDTSLSFSATSLSPASLPPPRINSSQHYCCLVSAYPIYIIHIFI